MFGSGENWNEAEASSSTAQTQRWTEYEYKQVEQAPQLMSIEEELHHFSRRILRQGTGEAQLKYDPKKPTIAIETPAPGSPDFPTVWASPELVAEFKAQVYRNMGLLNAGEVRQLISQRQQNLLAPRQENLDSALSEFESSAEVLAEQVPVPRPRKKAARSMKKS